MERNRNTVNTDPVPIVYDINSLMTVSNFRGQIPLPTRISASTRTSAMIYLGPASDTGYVVTAIQWISKDGLCVISVILNFVDTKTPS